MILCHLVLDNPQKTLDVMRSENYLSKMSTDGSTLYLNPNEKRSTILKQNNFYENGESGLKIINYNYIIYLEENIFKETIISEQSEDKVNWIDITDKWAFDGWSNINYRNGYNFIDLFSGIGGFHQAMVNLGGKCVLASEIDEYAISTYFANYHIDSAHDITLIDDKDVPKHDVLCGGFPCQTFSKAGKQLGFSDETKGTLFFQIVS